MKIKPLLIFALLLVALTIVLRCSSPGGRPSMAVGQPAPEFQIPDLAGRQTSLTDFKGKIVMLDFWATWCGPCRMSMPMLEELQREYAHDMVLLAINLHEPPETVRSYIEARQLKSRVLLDQEGSVGGSYGSNSIPMQVLIDQDGIVRHVQVGFSPQVGALLKEEINKLRKSS